MNETLIEAITRNLLEKNDPSAVARKLVDEKLKELILYLNDGSCVGIRKFYMDIPEFEICKVDGIELFIEDSDKFVVISKEDIEKAFKISGYVSSNSRKFEESLEAVYTAFYAIPCHCPYFKDGDDCLRFSKIV